MVIQKSHGETSMFFTDQNGADSGVDITCMDEGRTEFILQAKAQNLDINSKRSCDCEPSHINCLTAKEWIKCQIGVWQFNYEKRDIRDKEKHPATFPISLARRCIELFSHQRELVLAKSTLFPPLTEANMRYASRTRE